MPREYFHRCAGDEQRDVKDVNNDFNYIAKSRQVCKVHRTQEIKFYDHITNNFVCELCVKKKPENDYVPIADKAAEVQETL